MTEKEQQLEVLFREWKEVHRLIGPGEQERALGRRKTTTFPNPKMGPCETIMIAGAKYQKPYYFFASDFYLSFCRDGFLKAPEEGRKTILYIFREANITPKVNQPTYDLLHPNTDDRFWMKEQYDAYLNGGKEDRYVKFIRETAEKYGGMDELNLAYMNLNKRGGFGECDTKSSRLPNYVELYKPLICREIEIIDPDVIICGGPYDTVLNYKLADGLVQKSGEWSYSREAATANLIWQTNKSEIILRDFNHPKAPGGIVEKKKNAINLVTKKPINVD